MARSLHRSSDRRDKPFIVLNCAAVAETLIESELFGVEPGSYTGADKSRQGLTTPDEVLRVTQLDV